MPGDRALLDLNMASSCPLQRFEPQRRTKENASLETHLCIIPENFFNLRHPVHIQVLRKVRPLLAPPLTYETTMFRRKAHVLQVSEVLLEERAVAP